MEHVQKELGVSGRRACRVLGQARSTQRHCPCEKPGEKVLVARMIDLATTYGRYGYRRITRMLRTEGFRVNHERVERLWRREGLKVPPKQPKRGSYCRECLKNCVSGRPNPNGGFGCNAERAGSMQ